MLSLSHPIGLVGRVGSIPGDPHVGTLGLDGFICLYHPVK